MAIFVMVGIIVAIFVAISIGRTSHPGTGIIKTVFVVVLVLVELVMVDPLLFIVCRNQKG